jgi:hypothetical protein
MAYIPYVITYHTTPKLLAEGTLDWDTSTICAALLTNTYTPARTHTTWADVSASEVVHAGYTAGGNVCTGPSITNTTTNTSLKITVPPFTPTGTSMTVRYLVFYKRAAGAVASTDKIIGYVELKDDSGTTDLTIGAGFSLTVAAANGWWNFYAGI